jgi:hypothetical protein
VRMTTRRKIGTVVITVTTTPRMTIDEAACR